ncbi:MAG TPA: VWA domain-containing protein, partial [Gemmataceae bacterium]|nr:VWA domain-containing protein [Gemmataceae bacterium]
HQTGRGSNLPIRVLVRSYNPNVVVGTLSVNQIKYKAWYEVTDAVLDNLTLDGVPADTRERLAALKGQKFYSDREWFNALVKAVGRKDLAQFGQKLMARSKHEGFSKPVPDSPRQVELQPGLNAFTFRQVLDDDKAGQDSFTYRAEFQPLFVKDGKTGRVLAKGLPGDRVENNRAFTHVVARGQRRVLLIEQPPKPGQPREHELLEQRLAEAGGGQKFKVDVLTTEKLPKDKDRLAVILSNYDCVILANVPADQVSETQQELIRSNTHDQGCGLVMIGGPDSFGAGGWQKTPVEKALPVDCDIKSLKVTGKGGLVLIMHASEMADGNFWQKKIAKLAVEKLAPRDELGVIHFDWGLNKWHIPLQEVGEKRGFFYGQIDRMTPGDMPEVDSALQMAYNSLMEPARELSTRHIIFISDGDPQQQNKNLLAQMRKDKVTVTTVGVATHGAPQDQALLSIATATGGRFHNVRNPAMLPQIYIQETRLVSQSFVYESKNGFPPVLSPRPGPTDGLPRQLPKLYGFVRTTPKPSALVETPIMTPQFAEQDFPLLAYWHYGLGKGVAFTSDARKAWDRDWAASPIFSKFWEGVIDWSLRPVESKRLAMTTEVKDGRVLVRVDARKDGPQGPGTGGPDMGLTLRGYVTFPGAKPGEGRPLTFRQTAPGQYEAEFKSDEAGSYFIDAASVKPQKVKGKDGRAAEQDVVLDSVRAGVTIPYSPEFADLEANTALLEKLRELTDGRSYADEERELAEAAAAVKRAEGRDEKAKAEAEQERLAKAMAEAMFRPGLRQAKSLQNLWHWLVFATAVLLLFDVAVRRISVDPVEVAAKAQAVWDRVRGRPVAVPQTAEFLDRLRTRKAQVGETIGKAARRYEGGDMPAGPVPTAADDLPATPSGPRPTSRPASLAPGQPGSEEPEDFASRLMKAKRRAMQDREKRKDNE